MNRRLFYLIFFISISTKLLGANYLSLGIARSTPTADSLKIFIPGKSYLPILGFKHQLSEDWTVGISSQFKLFRDLALSSQPDEDDRVPFWTLSEEVYHNIRIYQETRLLVGAKFLYLLPVREVTFPLRRHSNFRAETGAAFTLGIIQPVYGKIYATIQIDRWRGINSNRYHGFELHLSLLWKLDP